MALKTKKSSKVTKENFLFSEDLVDLKERGVADRVDRDIEKELFGQRKFDKVVDAFESRLGLKRRAQTQMRVETKSKVFDFDNPEDEMLFKKLMNSKKYNIIFTDRNWTVHGTLKMFVVYQVNLDAKEEESLVTTR